MRIDNKDFNTTNTLRFVKVMNGTTAHWAWSAVAVFNCEFAEWEHVTEIKSIL